MSGTQSLNGLTGYTQANTGDKFPRFSAAVGHDRSLLWSELIDQLFTTPPINLWGQFAKIEQGASAQAVLAMVGDSWTQNSYITQPLNTYLQTAYGNAGDGYVGIGNSHGAPSSAVTFAKTGTWTEHDNGGSPQGNGVDIADSNSSDTSTPAQVTIVGTFNVAVIHFQKMSGGGDFRYRIDGGSWTVVSTANASTAYATTTISGLSTASHTLDIQIANAGSTGVTLYGVDLQRTTTGLRLHRLGNGGATAAQYAAADATLWRAGLTALAPTAVAIMLGTNDMSGNVGPTSFGTSIETLIARVNAALPLVDVILYSPADNGLTGKSYPISDYRNELRNVASRRGGYFIDTYTCIGSYANANTRGLYLNSSHLNNYGGQVIADTLYRALRSK